LVAEENVIFSEGSIDTFGFHEIMAFILVVLVLIQFFWRFTNKGKITVKLPYLYYLVAIASLICVIGTSYFGGKLVFNYGIGVKTHISKDINKNIKEKNPAGIQFMMPDSTN
jgi:uncharacterized membrane protein